MLQVGFQVHGAMDAWSRYGFLGRLRRTAERRQVAVMGFAIGPTVRLLLRGRRDDIAATVGFTKMGTVQAAQHRGARIEFGPTMLRTIWDPSRALVELHTTGGACPLSDPWTSHRDLLGFRLAPFFDPTVWGLDPRWVHIEAGGHPLPTQEAQERQPLKLLLHTAGTVSGVLPANRACFALFAQLATRLGWKQAAIAKALMLTPRRVRQLRTQPAPRLRAALISLNDDRLGPV